ncbi:hypothetical protein PMAYCL1PPCAC_04989, partial [Pristionchus mayeri]
EFLRWIYPASVRNYEEDGMSRVVALAKKVNVKIDDTYRYHWQYTGAHNFDWKSTFTQIENSPAYKAMDGDSARDMLQWMFNKCSRADDR